ncbi:MAG: DUF58 domain-containing protein [Gammaproteobacteria bacterium]|nr:DUF58 domain-containing protein [Gammaproteobacteria bacterium]
MLWRKSAHESSAAGTEPGDGIHLRLDELLAFKSRLGPIRLPAPRRAAGALSGGHVSPFKGRGMDFDEVRPYQEGDDVRAIDWRVTARTGRAHTKLYREERERPVHLVVDHSDSLYFGTRRALKSVTAARAAACLSWAALAAGHRVGALLFGSHDHLELKPAQSRRAVMGLMRQLCERHNARLPFLFSAQTLTRENVLLMALRRLRKIMRPGSLVYVLSDFLAFDSPERLELGELARHADVQVILISDPLERHLPPGGRYGFCDGVDTLRIDTGDRALCARYDALWTEHRQGVRDFCVSRGIAYAELGTEQELAGAIAEILRRQGRLA